MECWIFLHKYYNFPTVRLLDIIWKVADIPATSFGVGAPWPKQSIYLQKNTRLTLFCFFVRDK